MKTYQKVVDQIPAIDAIADAALRDSVVQTWLSVWEASSYSEIDQAPASGSLPARSLLAHVNGVNDRARDFLQIVRDSGLEVNADVVLAGAVLHDVDKMLIYDWDGVSLSKSHWAERSSHGPLGADMALDAGVPVSIADLIRYHSPVQNERGLPSTTEALIVFYADMFDADMGAIRLNAHTHFSRMRHVRRDAD